MVNPDDPETKIANILPFGFRMQRAQSFREERRAAIAPATDLEKLLAHLEQATIPAMFSNQVANVGALNALSATLGASANA